jgi:hypothetical protein
MQRKYMKTIYLYLLGALLGGIATFFYFYAYQLIIVQYRPSVSTCRELFLKALLGIPLGALTSLSFWGFTECVKKTNTSFTQIQRACYYIIIISLFLSLYILYSIISVYYYRVHFLIMFQIFTYEDAYLWFAKRLFLSLFSNAYFLWIILLLLRNIWLVRNCRKITYCR